MKRMGKKRKKIRYDRLVMLVLMFAFSILTIITCAKSINNAITNAMISDMKVSYTNKFIRNELEERIIERIALEERLSDVDIHSHNNSDSVKLINLGEFLLTGYCDCAECQEEWVGTTALGVAPTINNTIAVDPNLIPLGSYVWIGGVRYHAEDVGGMIKDNHIDIFVGSHEECYSDFCNRYTEVYLEASNC